MTKVVLLRWIKKLFSRREETAIQRLIYIKWYSLAHLVDNVDKKGREELRTYLTYESVPHYRLKKPSFYKKNKPKMVKDYEAFMRVVNYLFEQYPKFDEVSINVFE